ncbi:MAG TPA: PilZ domain-containing protein [Rhodocyclaceae bacterium]|jgi:hypothetical protein
MIRPIIAAHQTMDDHRKHPRHPLHLKVILHLPGADAKILHGETYDVSLDGAAIHTEHNVFTGEEFLVELLLPPEITGKAPQSLKIHARMVYTLYSSTHYCFRSGLFFRKFQGNSLALLETKLNQHPKLTG